MTAQSSAILQLINQLPFPEQVDLYNALDDRMAGVELEILQPRPKNRQQRIMELACRINEQTRQKLKKHGGK